MEKIRDILQELEARYDIKIIYACESGSRAWGIESTDSDFDIRFIYMFKDHKKYISLKQNKETIDGFSIDRVYDWQGFDITKALKLLNQMNPSLAEWVHSSIIYKVDTNYNFREKAVKLLLEQNRIYPLLYHYRSMAKSNFKAHLHDRENVKIKKYLYVIRPTGMVLWLLKCKNNDRNCLIINDFNLVLDDLKPYLSGEIYDNIIDLIRKKKNLHEIKEEPRIKCIDNWIDYILNETEGEILKTIKTSSQNNDNLLDKYDDVLHSFLNLKFQE